MGLISAYKSTINETKEKHPFNILTIHICDIIRAKEALNGGDETIEFAELYLCKSYGERNHMEAYIPVIDDNFMYIPSALDYVLTRQDMDRLYVKDETGNEQTINTLVISVPKKLFKKKYWEVTDIGYKFLTYFPELTVIVELPDGIEDDKDVLKIFKRKNKKDQPQ